MGRMEVKDRHALGKNEHAYSVVASGLVSMMSGTPAKGTQ
jgi:hypothetical protein